MDDFLVQYTDLKDFQHLVHTLEQYYPINTDMKADKFVGNQLRMELRRRTCHPIHARLLRKSPPALHAPSSLKTTACSLQMDRTQLRCQRPIADPEDTSKPLDKHGTKRLQEVIGTLLFYARAVDNTMLTALGTIASAQSAGTEKTMDAITHLLDYTATTLRPKSGTTRAT